MASIVFPLAGKIEEALQPLLPAAVARQVAELDAFLLGSYGLQHGTVLVLLVLLALLLPLLLAPVFSGGDGKAQSRKGRNAVLIVGPSESGKTAMFHMLNTGRNVETVTSMKPGILHYESSRGPLEMIDFPGHQRLQGHLKPLLKRAMKVIFMIDSSSMTSQLRPAAELMYDILTDPAMDNGPPILVACNKCDVSTARAPARVKLMLQQEIEKVRKTRETLSSRDEDDQQRMVLGVSGQPFSFERDSPCEVTFEATSAVNGTIDAIRNFIDA